MKFVALSGGKYCSGDTLTRLGISSVKKMNEKTTTTIVAFFTEPSFLRKNPQMYFEDLRLNLFLKHNQCCYYLNIIFIPNAIVNILVKCTFL